MRTNRQGYHHLRHRALLGMLIFGLATSGCGTDDQAAAGPAGADATTGGQDAHFDATADATGGSDATTGGDATQHDSGGTDVGDDAGGFDSGGGTDAGGADSSDGGGVVISEIVAIGIDPPAISLPVGGQIAFTLTGKLADGSSADVTALATWTSTAPGVVAVSPGGGAVAIGAGSAEVRAQIGALQTAAKISVVPSKLVALAIAPETASIVVGEALQLGAVGTFADGTKQNLGLVVAWSSEAPEIVAVGKDGTVTGKAGGSATIEAKLGDVSATATITVLTSKPTGLAIEPIDPTVPVGGGLALSAIATYDDSGTADVSAQAAWSSASPDVAQVDGKGNLIALSAGSCLITAKFAGLSAERLVTIIAPKLQKLIVDPTTLTLPAGGSGQLTAKGTWDDGSTTDLTASAVWEATPPGVVSVSNAPGSQGKITGQAPGSAKVTATFGGITTEAVVTVAAAQLASLAITPPTPSAPKGVTLQLELLGTYDDGSVEKLTDAAVWGSNNPTVVTVSTSGKTIGQATAVGIGQASVTASYDGLTTTAIFTVSAAALTGVKVEPAKVELEAGQKTSLAAKATYSDGAEVDVTQGATWSVGNTQIAEVQNSAGAAGVLNAKAPGATTVTATLGNKSGQASVTVKAPTLSELQIGPIDPERKAGQQVQFFVMALYSNGTSQNVTFQAEWSSSNTNVASIGNTGAQKGRAQAKNAGTATITATFGGKSVTTTMKVTDPDPVEVQISPAYWEMATGTPMQLQAIVIFSDGSSQNVTFQAQWSGSDGKIASVGNGGGPGGPGGPGGQGPNVKGRIIALTPGTITVTATYQGLSGKATIVVKPASPVAISIFPGIQDCAPGQFRAVQVTLQFSDGSSLPVTQAATFTSSNAAVASALNGQNQKGFVQCLSAGEAKIKATFQGFTAEASITVKSATLDFLAIAPGAATVAKGVPVMLQVTAHFTDGSSQPINGQATLTSDNPAVAAVIDAGPLSGVVQTLTPGKATITAQYGGKKATAVVTVTAATVQELQITPSAPNLAPGSWTKFEAVAVMSDQTTQQVTNLASWASSAPAVLAIDDTPGGLGKGLAQAISAGTTVVSATWGGVTAKVSVEVKAATLVEIQVTPFVPTLAVGMLTPFKATGIYSDFTTQDLTNIVSWTSSAPAVGSISSTLGTKGFFTPLGGGKTTVKAVYLGKTGSSEVTVTDAKLQKIVVSPQNASVEKGKMVQLQATGDFGGGLQLNLTPYVTWLPTTPGIVAISNAWGSKGEMTGLSPGATTVEAIFAGVKGSTKVTVK